MKNIVLKSSLIGLLVGIIMSYNMMFIGAGGILFYFISLGFIQTSLRMDWISGLIFFVLVYVLYGTIIGFLIKKFLKR